MQPRTVPSSTEPFHVEIDVVRKLLEIHFRGVVRGGDMKAGLERLPGLLPTLGPGFAMMTDLTELELMNLDCVGPVATMMDACLAAGVGRIVRIIPDPNKDIGFKLLSLTHYRGKVPIQTFETRADAEKEVPLT